VEFKAELREEIAAPAEGEREIAGVEGERETGDNSAATFNLPQPGRARAEALGSRRAEKKKQGKWQNEDGARQREDG
jgi:hypothetical protein